VKILCNENDAPARPEQDQIVAKISAGSISGSASSLVPKKIQRVE